MHHRQNALYEWLAPQFTTKIELVPLAGDASFRHYFRFSANSISYVVMDAPPDKEPVDSFINIGNTLQLNGIHTPEIFALDKTQGFVLLEDLGDQLLFHALTPENADELYCHALSALLKIQRCPKQPLPLFDKAYMLNEMMLFKQWFLEAYLGLTLTKNETALLLKAFTELSEALLQQPQVFIHRDYHSRNLLVVPNQKNIDIGVIDFQDAMQGPITYDVVSLLKDCYIQWPRGQIIHWLSFFHKELACSRTWPFAEFIHAFDLCGLQRHLKVLGIFCRLHLRDAKSGYLKELPRVMAYFLDCLENYSEFESLRLFVHEKVQKTFNEMSLV